MDINFQEIIAALLFLGGVPAITAAVNWVKRFFPDGVDPPKWVLAVLPITFGLLINVTGVWVLGFFAEHGAVAVVASIIMGVVAGFAAMGIYDNKHN